MNERGFTLVELMITILVGAILLGIAIPSFRTFIQNTRLSGEAGALVYSLTLARDEAVKRDASVEVCASSDGATCTGTWSQGWIVCTPAPACTTVVQVAPALANGNTLAEQINAATTLSFDTNGSTGTAYQFVLCDDRGAADGRDVEINLIGRVEPSQTAGQQVSGTALAGC